MKKLGFVIMIALVLTVGGVYATFDYAQNDVASQDAVLTKTIAGTKTDNAKGTIAIDVETFQLKIDDVGVKDLKTGLETQGFVTVTFTPAQGADGSVADEGIDLKLEIAFENNTYTQNGTPYELFKTTLPSGTTSVALGKGTKNSAGAFEYQVQLGNYLAVNEIPLPTLADYDAFSAWFTDVNNAKITITVSEVK